MAEKDPEQEEDINEADEREQMTDDAEIEPREGGFVEGYEKDEEESMNKKKKKKSQIKKVLERNFLLIFILLKRRRQKKDLQLKN